MKRSVVMAVAAVSLLASVPSDARTTGIEISPEHGATIREHVVRERIPAATIPGEGRVGVVLPGTVELAPVPDTWGPSVRRYRYVHWNNHVVLVEPSSRRVIQIID